MSCDGDALSPSRSSQRELMCPRTLSNQSLDGSPSRLTPRRPSSTELLPSSQSEPPPQSRTRCWVVGIVCAVGLCASAAVAVVMLPNPLHGILPIGMLPKRWPNPLRGMNKQFSGSARTNTTTTITTTRTSTTTPHSDVIEFYTYRAVADGAFEKYPFGNTNTGNLDGVMWYLTNEVVTKYTKGTRCPRKFDISKIMRFKMRTKATPELFKQNMDFGARFAYDFGKCTGRCYSDNKCTSTEDCRTQYSKYGFVVGCNTFSSKSVFPEYDTSAPDGIWYSFPLEGRCSHPTGAHNCTWSYEEAGTISLQDLEERVEGDGNCCYGRCSGFWDSIFEKAKTKWRVQIALDVFAKKYPFSAMERLAPATCDFQPLKWYNPDNWTRQDPWAKAKA
mmetsp:Transcript_22019/g.45022  ORF Transcript_22019/g.45022 Transcript_22019/m.45022 type:complete len:390 (+) Transcript_22019:91-1260(+)